MSAKRKTQSAEYFNLFTAQRLVAKKTLRFALCALRLKMDSQIAIDLSRNMIWMAILIAVPVLASGVAIGLVIGLLQALTQIQEQTIGIVLKILVMVIVLTLLLPWMTEKMLDYSTELYTLIPERLYPG